MIDTIIKIKNRAFGSKLITDSLWAVFGNVIGKGMSFAAGVLIARLLGSEEFGEFGIIKNTIASIAVFSTFGLGYTATKYVSEFKDNPRVLRQILSYSRNITLIVSGILALSLFISAKFVSTDILGTPQLKTSIRIISIWIVFSAVTTTQIGILSGLSAFKELAKINGIVGITTFILSFLLTLFFNLNGALIALLGSQVVNCFLNSVHVKKSIDTEFHNVLLSNNILWKDMLSFSLPISIQESVYSLTNWLSYLLLIQFTTYYDIGHYSASMQWFSIMLFIPGSLRNVILSHLSSNNNNQEHHSSILKKGLIINFIASLIPALTVMILSDYIQLIYGNSFDNLSLMIRLAVCVSVFSSMSNVYSQAYMSMGWNWQMVYMRTLRDFSILIISYLLFTNLEQTSAVYMLYSMLLANIIFLILMGIVYEYRVRKS